MKYLDTFLQDDIRNKIGGKPCYKNRRIDLRIAKRKVHREAMRLEVSNG